MRKRILRWVVGLFLLWTVGVSSAQSGIRAVVVNEFLNIRISPALGATVLDTVEAGHVFDNINARSGDGQWLRITYQQCVEAWINIAPMVILQGDINSLPLADPRSIPYGGFDSPRSGYSTQQGPVYAAATDGVRVRGGPSTAYPTLANINFNQAFTITGRNECNTWYQVNFENTLGWIAGSYLRVIEGDVYQTPVGGIVAESSPPSGESLEEYVATLKLMRDRLLLAQDSLISIRSSWTDAALQGRAVCQAYPAQPSNIHVPVPMMAAFYQPLNTLVNDFNDAMFNTRQAIDLFIQVCNQPGTANPVGQATVQGALGIVNLAEQQYASLLKRLEELIPNEEIGPNQCLLRFNAKSEVIPRISTSTVYLDEFTRRTYARGYCFDAIESQTIVLQTLPIPPSDLEIFVAISPLNDPTDFLLVSQGIDGQRQQVGPLVIRETGTYLLIIADLGGDGRSPVGEFAFTISDLTFGTSLQNLSFDEATQSVILEDAVLAGGTLQEDGSISFDNIPDGDDFTTAPDVCPSLEFTCDDFFTCDEAQACYDAGNFLLDDEDNVLNGIPCEQGVCFGQGNAGQVQCPSLQATCDQLTAQQVAVCYAQGNQELDTDGDGIACEGTHNVIVGQ